MINKQYCDGFDTDSDILVQISVMKISICIMNRNSCDVLVQIKGA